jgi:CRISPR-associated protein Cmr2
MSKHLLAISIGPVQDFIAAARRTADLYAGSQLLVEIANTIVNHIVDKRYGTLIFPANPNTDGPNKIIAEITNADPATVSKECRNAALDYLREVWRDAMEQIPKSHFDEDNANKQIESFLEFYSAWLEWDGQEGTYESKRQQLDRLLAGRKALRDFLQPDKVNNRPKSPLDPSRDCVLKISGKEAVPQEYQTHPLWLKQRETLDALSLLKRVRGDKLKNVFSTSRMAAQAILPAVQKVATHPDQNVLKNALTELNTLVEQSPSGIDMGDLMFPNRLEEEIEALQKAQDKKYDKRRDEVLKLLSNQDIPQWRKTILDAAKSLGYRGSECPPYYAIVAADGDRMGALIGELKSKEKHHTFSQLLSDFARKARAIVETDHNGFRIYSGGDDVLALLPLNQALKCAASLAGKFREILTSKEDIKNAIDALNKTGKPGGSLSVAIAIVHHMDPLLVSLEHARAAEKEAKNHRNALAVALHTRAGEPILVAERWNDQYDVTDWQDWIDAFRNGLARGFPYELRTLAREFQAEEMPVDRLQEEANRIYERKEKKTSLPLPDFEKSPRKLEDFAKKLVIARFLSTYEVNQ